VGGRGCACSDLGVGDYLYSTDSTLQLLQPAVVGFRSYVDVSPVLPVRPSSTANAPLSQTKEIFCFSNLTKDALSCFDIIIITICQYRMYIIHEVEEYYFFRPRIEFFLKQLRIKAGLRQSVFQTFLHELPKYGNNFVNSGSIVKTCHRDRCRPQLNKTCQPKISFFPCTVVRHKTTMIESMLPMLLL